MPTNIEYIYKISGLIHTFFFPFLIVKLNKLVIKASRIMYTMSLINFAYGLALSLTKIILLELTCFTVTLWDFLDSH